MAPSLPIFRSVLEQEMEIPSQLHGYALSWPSTWVIEIRNLAQEEAEAEQSEQEEVADSEGDVKNTNELTEDDIEVLPPSDGGNVKVTVDDIARPGLMASGRVTFASGQGGMWYVDEMGRLGIDPEVEGYQPSEADVMAFQRELQLVMDAR